VRSRRITIVEDDENIAGLLAFLLDREGFAPDVLRDGRAALRHVRESVAPAAVIVDQMLPYCDGLAVASAMRADAKWSAVPIVLLRSAAPSKLEPARSAGLVDACVSKPFDPGAVVKQVKMLARRPR
jgi:two-component system catabolic regulation response regulator CreB